MYVAFTTLLQNYINFVKFTCKKGVTKTLIDQTFHSNDQTFNSNDIWDDFHLDLEKLKVILQKNEYPPKLTDKSVKNI